MTSFEAVVLGIIQGITEMLPVSSSTHLMLFSLMQGLPNQRHSFDIFLNIGTLAAVIVFFAPQFWNLTKGGVDFLRRKNSHNRDFFLIIVLANIPTIVFFGLAEIFFDINFHSPFLISSSLIIFALILWRCDREGDRSVSENSSSSFIKKKLSQVTMQDAIFTGLAQLFAIIPGVSRLGVCYSVMRYLRYSRQIAFRFSMILSIVPVTGACFLKTLKLFTGQIVIENVMQVSIGCIFSFVFGLITLYWIDSFFKNHSALCFVIYRIIFGLFILTQYKIF
ncbi:MAG: undecaprenyl-diphosphate phosphatase [Alphaproteobacteria bacterium]|nr:undecaprenyl-diphosphate phosphatase [Alphaproteobacteria bacterium]